MHCTRLRKDAGWELLKEVPPMEGGLAETVKPVNRTFFL